MVGSWKYVFFGGWVLKTNMSPEKWWFGKMCFFFWMAYFQGDMFHSRGGKLLKGRVVGKIFPKLWWFTRWARDLVVNGVMGPLYKWPKIYKIQVIQFATFLSPNVEGHDSPVKGSRKLTGAQRGHDRRIARICGFPLFFFQWSYGTLLITAWYGPVLYMLSFGWGSEDDGMLNVEFWVLPQILGLLYPHEQCSFHPGWLFDIEDEIPSFNCGDYKKPI